MSIVISLKKHIEAMEYLEVMHDPRAGSTLDSYRAALVAMANCSVQAFPQLGSGLKQSLLVLHDRLTAEAAPAAVADTEQHVEKELRQWGERASEYLKQKATEVRDLMLMVARTADAVGERDQRYSGQFVEFTARLEAMADLDDLPRIRASLAESAQELRTCVHQMERDGRESVARLQVELSAYRTRLEEAERQAAQDALTGLANRRSVEQQLDYRVRQGLAFSVMIFDLNEFKQVNDRHGHLGGDDLLRQFGHELQSAFRASDIVGRWGGDEFVVVLDCDFEKAESQLGRIRDWVLGDYVIRGDAEPRKVSITAAIGLAEWRLGETVAELLERADAAMYRDKGQPLPAAAIEPHV